MHFSTKGKESVKKSRAQMRAIIQLAAKLENLEARSRAHRETTKSHSHCVRADIETTKKEKVV